MMESPALTASPPSEKERASRYAKIKEEMRKRQIDCLIITGYSGRWNMMNANVRYVSNYSDNLSTASFLVFPLDGDGTYVTQMMVKRSLAETSWVKDIRPRATGNAAVLIERIKKLGLKEGHIGLVGAGYMNGDVVGMPYNVYLELTKEFPKAKFTDDTDIFTTLRYVKSREELELMRLSTEVCDAAFKAMLPFTKPGVRENEWFAQLQKVIYNLGAEQPFFIIGTSGQLPAKEPEFFKNDVIFTNRVLKQGDVILSEFSPSVCGYMAQSLQLISLGKAHPDVVSAVECSLEVYNRLIGELKAGNTLGNFMKTARRMAEEYKGVMGDNIQALTPIVHGVGLMAPEPTLREGDAFEFKPGMVMMLELGPPSQKPAYTWLGTPFVITEGAPRSLTKIPFEERALAVV